MNIIKIQLNHTENLTLNELSSPFYAEIGEEYDLSKEDVQEFFTIESRLLLPNTTFVTIFLLNFPELELRDQTPEDIVKSYLNTLQQKDSVLSIVKTNDSVLFERAQQYYQEIIELEMEIRNVLTYIFNSDERDIDKQLLSDFDIKPQVSYNKNETHSLFENIFFHLLFSDYSKFTQPKKLNDQQIINILRNRSIQSFEDFRNQLLEDSIKGISIQRHQDFLLSLVERLANIEKMRNSIMHIRNLSNNVIRGYKRAVETFENEGEIVEKGIRDSIRDFWSQEQTTLKQNTWVALAQSQIRKVVTTTIESRNGEVVFCTNRDHYDFELEEEYADIDSLKADLLQYLFEYVEVRDFNPETPDFAESLSTMVDSTLQGMVDEQQQDEL
ncbi:MAG: hypothetical protein AB4060_02495 [Crocosphaera sp.]